MAKPTQATIKTWIAEHGEVEKVNIKGSESIYLKPLDNETFAMCVSMYGRKEVFKANEVALRTSYLGGNSVVEQGLKNPNFPKEPKKARIYRTAVQAAGNLIDFLEHSSETLS